MSTLVKIAFKYPSNDGENLPAESDATHLEIPLPYGNMLSCTFSLEEGLLLLADPLSKAIVKG